MAGVCETIDESEIITGPSRRRKDMPSFYASCMVPGFPASPGYDIDVMWRLKKGKSIL
jgi:hypothetical protein